MYKKNEPIRHHYIPQFILRNFSFNDKHKLYFYDSLNKEVSIKRTKEIFMENNLYRDEILDKNNPTSIEKNLSKFENEIAKIINKKFLIENEIIITQEEDEMLKLFFAILPFRSMHTKKIFENKLKEDSKEFYS